jgi:hypothetical protein
MDRLVEKVVFSKKETKIPETKILSTKTLFVKLC